MKSIIIEELGRRFDEVKGTDSEGVIIITMKGCNQTLIISETVDRKFMITNPAPESTMRNNPRRIVEFIDTIEDVEKFILNFNIEKYYI